MAWMEGRNQNSTVLMVCKLKQSGIQIIRKLNETQSKFDLDNFDYVNVGGYEQRERIANSLAQ